MTSGPGSRRIVLFDGECRMCSGWARFVGARDPHGELELVPQQSDEGREVLARHGIPVDDMSTIVFVDGERVLTKSNAVFAILDRLRRPWPLLSFFLLVPRVIRDALYDVIARNRRRIFGAQKCEWVPPKGRS